MARKNQTLSQLDPGQVLKNVHDADGCALRVSAANSQVPSGYSKVVLTNNADGSVTRAVFYAGTAAEKTRISVLADVAGSLNNKAFTLNTAEDEQEFYVWYNVDNTGTDPAIAGKCPIEVPISTNDNRTMIALATKLYLEATKLFTANNNKGILTIENIELGVTTPTADIDTGFTITSTSTGVTERTKCIDLPYENGAKYTFNHAEGKFVITPNVSGEFVIVGLSTASPIVEIVTVDSSWIAVPVTVASGETMAINVQNQHSTNSIKLNWGSDPGVGSTVGMQIYPNGGERQYVIKNNVTMYLRSLSGNVTVSLEVIS